MSSDKVGDDQQGGQPVSGASQAGLLVEPESAGQSGTFNVELAKTLEETERQIVSIADPGTVTTESWEKARRIVQELRPIPWFIWRLSNYVYNSPGQINKVSEGMVFGMRRLMFAMASDPLLGIGEKVNDVRKALSIASSDVIASVSVIHAINRRLAGRPYEHVWKPLIEDALLRSEIGYHLGKPRLIFGAGRSMLAGFIGALGLPVLIAYGEESQAQAALERLACGDDNRQVGRAIYQCDPFQVSAMVLSACACGRDAAFGAARHASPMPPPLVVTDESRDVWRASFVLIDALRAGTQQELPDEVWKSVYLSDPDDKAELISTIEQLLRNGCGWQWMM